MRVGGIRDDYYTDTVSYVFFWRLDILCSDEGKKASVKAG